MNLEKLCPSSESSSIAKLQAPEDTSKILSDPVNIKHMNIIILKNLIVFTEAICQQGRLYLFYTI